MPDRNAKPAGLGDLVDQLLPEVGLQAVAVALIACAIVTALIILSLRTEDVVGTVETVQWTRTITIEGLTGNWTIASIDDATLLQVWQWTGGEPTLLTDEPGVHTAVVGAMTTVVRTATISR